MGKKCYLGCIMDKCIAWSTHLYCVQEICLKQNISMHRMCMKCHLSCVRTHGISPIQCIRNVQEISCVLGTGNAHEIGPYTVSGNPQEMYKFHVVRNVHTMNRKCDPSYTFLGISQPRKFKISSSDIQKGVICHPKTPWV